MAMKSLQELRSSFKAPLLTHRWYVEMQNPSGYSADNSQIMFYVTTAGVPTSNVELATVQLGGFTYNFNGKEDRHGQLTWTFYENTNMEVIKYFMEYMKLRQNYESNKTMTLAALHDPELVSSSVTMYLLDADASTTIGKYELINCYFSVNQFTGELGQDATPSQITVNVDYDSWIFTPTGSGI